VSAGVIRLTARSVTAEVGPSTQQVCRTLDGYLGALSFEAPKIDVNLILYHPMGVSEPVKATGRYDSKREIYRATITVPYVEWCRGGWTDRVTLVSVAVRARLDRLPKSRFSPDQRSAVLSALEAGVAQAISRPPTSLAAVAPAYRVTHGGIAFDPGTLAPGQGRPITLAEIEAFLAEPPSPRPPDTQFKTYRKGDTALEYWEAWISDAGVIQHRGVCGQTGTTRSLPVMRSALATLEADKAEALHQGFRAIPETRLQTLSLELTANDADPWKRLLSRRNELEDWLNEELGWTGLGHCDGGDMGEGVATAFCLVVSRPLAMALLKSRLPASPFSDAIVRRN
jgi:hypothetical protein